MRVLATMCVLIALAVPAAAQSFKDAALNNFAVATRVCADIMLRQLAPRPAFTSAGFTYRADVRGVNSYGVNLGFGHYFDAPADTAKAEVGEPDRFTGTCYVYTTYATQPEIEALVTNVLRSAYPQAQFQTNNGGLTIRNLSALPLIVGFQTISRHRYEPAGTVSMSMSFPG